MPVLFSYELVELTLKKNYTVLLHSMNVQYLETCQHWKRSSIKVFQEVQRDCKESIQSALTACCLQCRPSLVSATLPMESFALMPEKKRIKHIVIGGGHFLLGQTKGNCVKHLNTLLEVPTGSLRLWRRTRHYRLKEIKSDVGRYLGLYLESWGRVK